MLNSSQRTPIAMRPLSVCFIVCILLTWSCKKTSPEPAPSPVPTPQGLVDIDGNAYDTVVICGRTWMATNLRVRRFRNGDSIPHRQDAAEWVLPDKNEYALYNNDPALLPTHGLLYGYGAVVDPRGLCPTGWHVPTHDEWKELETCLGMPASELDSLTDIGGGLVFSGAWRGEQTNVGGRLKALVSWNAPNQGADNSSGFKALASGERSMPGGPFQHLGDRAAFWSSTGIDGWVRGLAKDRTGILLYNHNQGSDQPGYGHSCRCIRDL